VVIDQQYRDFLGHIYSSLFLALVFLPELNFLAGDGKV
jgi:hypothetical protein